MSRVADLRKPRKTTAKESWRLINFNEREGSNLHLSRPELPLKHSNSFALFHLLCNQSVCPAIVRSVGVTPLSGVECRCDPLSLFSACSIPGRSSSLSLSATFSNTSLAGFRACLRNGRSCFEWIGCARPGWMYSEENSGNIAAFFSAFSPEITGR